MTEIQERDYNNFAWVLAVRSIIGKMVKNHRGPAAVIGDEFPHK